MLNHSADQILPPHQFSSHEEAQAHALSKLNKYSVKQLKTLANQELNFFMAADSNELKLTTASAVQLILQFLSESLEVTLPPPFDLIVENFDPELFSSGIIPFHFERLEETLRVLNSNLVFYQSMAMVC